MNEESPSELLKKYEDMAALYDNDVAPLLEQMDLSNPTQANDLRLMRKTLALRIDQLKEELGL